MGIWIVVALLAGIAVGLALGWQRGKGLVAAEVGKNALLTAEVERLGAEAADRVRQMEALQDERAQLMARTQVLASDVEHVRKQMEDARVVADREKQALADQHEILLKNERGHHAVEMESLRKSCERQLNSLQDQMGDERRHAAQMREQSDRQWAERMETLKQEMLKTAAEQLASKQVALQEHNRTQMDELLRPVKEQFADFKRSVEESRTMNEVSKKELQHTFEATMKLFQQEQQQAVSSLKEQTLRIGSDAANLTKALKGDSKMQGDWGEMVLETILENSGLRKGEEFFIQENTKDENGKTFRPDVVVRFPEGRSVVIDSKVSLTAYTEAIGTEDEMERERLLREHAVSVRRHIDELAEKDYAQLVDDAIGFVLMFIPNETSYIAAMKQQPDLSRYAYQKKIIIISPSNLLMALQLAYNLWQYDRQNKNVEKIVKTAADLYDKVAVFEDTFSGIGDLLTRLCGSYDKAKKQLYDGTGNVMRRVESLKSLGVTPKKRLKSMEE